MLFDLPKESKYSTLSSSRLAIRVTYMGYTKPTKMAWNGKPHSVCLPFLIRFPLDSSANFCFIESIEGALNTIHKSISEKDVKDKLFLRVLLFDRVKQSGTISVFPILPAGRFIKIHLKKC